MSSSSRIRVMVVDDHPVTMRGVSEVLEDAGGIEIVAQAADGVEAVDLAEGSRPDVIVMDVMIPKKDGVEACREILDLLPDTKVLILTASTEDDALIGAITAGAAGFVQKHSGGDQLVDAIRRVAEGEFMISKETVRQVITLLRAGTRAGPESAVLTERERKVLTLFSTGKSYSQIGESLGVSKVTARNAIYRVQNKLGFESKQEIVVWAVRNGLLDGTV